MCNSSGSLCHGRAQKPGHDTRSLPLAVISSVSYIPFRQVTIQWGKERRMEGGRERCQLPMTAPVDLLKPVAAGFSLCISYSWASLDKCQTHTHTQRMRMIFRAAKIWNQPINHFHTYLDSQSNRGGSLSGRRGAQIHEGNGLTCWPRLQVWVRQSDWSYKSTRKRGGSYWSQRSGEFIWQFYKKWTLMFIWPAALFAVIYTLSTLVYIVTNTAAVLILLPLPNVFLFERQPQT